MALAEYYERAALAASQAIRGFDSSAFRRIVEGARVGISVDAAAAESHEGQHLADLAVRLLARLYPTVEISADHTSLAEELQRLAVSINPRIELAAGAQVGIAVGERARMFPKTVFAGSDGWIGRVGTTRRYGVGASDNPFGPGAAACLAVANVFRELFLPSDSRAPDLDAELCAYHGARASDGCNHVHPTITSTPMAGTLVGLGAIGNAALWALDRADLRGTLNIVDHQRVELSNLQRYVLATLDDVDREKPEAVKRHMHSGLRVAAHAEAWAQFAERARHTVADVLVALDSARDRRAVQAALPRSVVNAWTQPGDLGMSVHAEFGSIGACLWCLYLAAGKLPNEDEIIAAALQIPDQQQQVRQLLHSGGRVSADLLDMIGGRLGIPSDVVSRWEGHTLRSLYADGLCGGALVPVERLGRPRTEMHVPLAHQSALAGVLLAAAFVARVDEPLPDTTAVTRIDVLRPLGTALQQPMGADIAGRCICRDPVYVARYTAKWPRGGRYQPHFHADDAGRVARGLASHNTNLDPVTAEARSRKEVSNMAKGKVTSSKAAAAASKTLRDGRTSKSSKAAAGSALSQRPAKKK